MTPKELRGLMLLIVATLLSIGCIAVYSATAITAHELTGSSLRFLAHHLVAILLGGALSLACLRIPYATMRGAAKPALGACVLLLILVGVFGAEIGGARRWFRLGRLSIQPSEFAQLALVVYLADFLARKQNLIREFREGFLPPMLVAALMAGMVLIQPDLGTAIVMGSVTILLLLVANARGWHLGGTLLLGGLALVVLVFSAEYRMRRIFAFVDPWKDPQGIGFQIIQSFVAMGHGGWVGTGLGASLQKLFFLPSAHTDFIFAVIGEELGLFGVTAVLGLFALLIGCGLRMAQLTHDLFSKYLIVGCIGMIGLEAVVNMAVVTGLLPTKGLPLPLISYGGTAIVTNLLACALILYGSRHGNMGWNSEPHHSA